MTTSLFTNTRRPFKNVHWRSRKSNLGIRLLLVVFVFSVFWMGTVFRQPEPSNSLTTKTSSRQLLDLSILQSIDGPGCGPQSHLGKKGLVLWCTLVLYIFLGLAIVCDDYFVMSLEVIAEKLNMSEDVAGATLMAAGSSSPELFAALIGAFFYPEHDPGEGTVVGSVVFNICCIIGGSILITGKTTKLHWWCIIRDVTFNIIAVALLYSFEWLTTRGRVDWWEALLMILTYFSYILLMVFDHKIMAFWKRREPALQIDKDPNQASAAGVLYARFSPADSGEKPWMDVVMRKELSVPFLSMKNENNLELESVQLDHVASENGSLLEEDGFLLPGGDALEEVEYALDYEEDAPNSRSFWGSFKRCSRSLWGSLKRLIHLICWPWHLLFGWTIPNCSKPKWRSWYMLTFTLCLCWLGFVSFLMVDLAEKIGSCIGLSAEITGLTLLAVGSSLPDFLGSLIVAKRGKCSMAVCNAFGSNVFDILFGLGVPWFLHAVYFGHATEIESHGHHMFVFMLLMIAVFLICVITSKWALKRWHGYILLLCYAGFLGFVFVQTTGVFG